MTKKQRGFIKSILIIITILIVVFLSQQPYFRPIGKNLFSRGTERINPYWLKTNEWINKNIYPRVSREVEERGGAVKEEVQKQKDIAVQSIWQKIKNYLAEKFSKFSGTEVE